MTVSGWTSISADRQSCQVDDSHAHRTGPKRSASDASPIAEECRVDSEDRGSRAVARHGSERKRRVQLKGRTTGARKGIDEKGTTSTLSIRSDFARTTVIVCTRRSGRTAMVRRGLGVRGQLDDALPNFQLSILTARTRHQFRKSQLHWPAYYKKNTAVNRTRSCPPRTSAGAVSGQNRRRASRRQPRIAVRGETRACFRPSDSRTTHVPSTGF